MLSDVLFFPALVPLCCPVLLSSSSLPHSSARPPPHLRTLSSSFSAVLLCLQILICLHVLLFLQPLFLSRWFVHLMPLISSLCETCISSAFSRSSPSSFLPGASSHLLWLVLLFTETYFLALLLFGGLLCTLRYPHASCPVPTTPETFADSTVSSVPLQYRFLLTRTR